MEDKTIYYEGMYSTKSRIVSLILFLVVTYFCALIASMGLSYLSLLYLIVAWLVFVGWLVSLNTVTRKTVLTLFPEGRVQVGLKDSFLEGQPVNTYRIPRGRYNGEFSYLFTLANIASVYQTSQITPGQKISPTASPPAKDPTRAFATKKDKTVCFEFKTPLISYNPVWKKIGDRDFWGKECPQLQRIYVSVTDPEKLVRYIQVKAGLKAQ